MKSYPSDILFMLLSLLLIGVFYWVYMIYMPNIFQTETKNLSKEYCAQHDCSLNTLPGKG